MPLCCIPIKPVKTIPKHKAHRELATGLNTRHRFRLRFRFHFRFHLLDAGRLLGVVEGRARGGELHERPDRLDGLIPRQQERCLGGRVLYSISI